MELTGPACVEAPGRKGEKLARVLLEFSKPDLQPLDCEVIEELQSPMQVPRSAGQVQQCRRQ